MKRIKAFFNPEQYHGWGKSSGYFEGWYFKIVDQSEKNALAVIPGVAMDENGNRHGFIQVLDGKKMTSIYRSFDFSDFAAAPGEFSIRMLDNYFSENKIRLNIPEVSGELIFSGNVKWPKTWHSPGIMGPYSFVPFMECYHGIVSMDHTITGHLVIDGRGVRFDNGRGYIEKDWGESFPEAYVWTQSNHFKEPGISVFASVAKIPWIRNSFTGFISLIWLHDRLIKFTTYNRSKLEKCKIGTGAVEIVMRNSMYRVEISIKRGNASSLASPIRGFMDGRIEESMRGEMNVRLTELKSGKTVFNDKGRNSGIEVAGRIQDIMI